MNSPPPSQTQLKAMLSAIDAANFPEGIPGRFSIHCFDRVSSTNQTLWNLVHGGASSGTVAIAAEQSAGRGQWGRQWHSRRGGLYLSAFWTPQIGVYRAAQLTLSSAWGIAIALGRWGVPVGLKWPNDLVLNGRKLGGVLAETRVQQGKIIQAVVGVGLNWSNPVPETGIALRSLWCDGVKAPISSLEMLAAIVLQGLAKGWQDWQQQGTEALLNGYQTLLVNCGQTVVVEGRSGIVVGVAANGDLRVRFHAETGEGPEIQLQPGTISLGYEGGRGGHS